MCEDGKQSSSSTTNFRRRYIDLLKRDALFAKVVQELDADESIETAYMLLVMATYHTQRTSQRWAIFSSGLTQFALYTAMIAFFFAGENPPSLAVPLAFGVAVLWGVTIFVTYTSLKQNRSFFDEFHFKSFRSGR